MNGKLLYSKINKIFIKNKMIKDPRDDDNQYYLDTIELILNKIVELLNNTHTKFYS